jgi:hypothetical protein
VAATITGRANLMFNPREAKIFIHTPSNNFSIKIEDEILQNCVNSLPFEEMIRKSEENVRGKYD